MYQPPLLNHSLEQNQKEGKALILVYIVDTIYTMKKYNLYLAERQINELEGISHHLGLSVSEVKRRALDSFIEIESQKLLPGPGGLAEGWRGNGFQPETPQIQ